jgi:5-methyltetrahydrofolate--homocysteine methyltransferase
VERERFIEAIHAAVAAGDADRARALADEAVRAGIPAVEVLEQGYTRALRQVGDCWERGDMFLPEMMLAAEAVTAALGALEPLLRSGSGRDAAAPACVLGTVEGDIHDIGKNIVGTLLAAFGFRVVDLGVDVAPDRFVAAVRDSGARLLGMSALLTSTMPAMHTVIETLRAAGLRDGVRIAVGGAPITRRFAADIGADGFAEDGMGALRLFQAFAGMTAAGTAP